MGIIDFKKPIREVRKNLLGTNTPYLLKIENPLYFDSFQAIRFPIVRIWNRSRPEKPDDQINHELLEQQHAAITRLIGNSNTKILFNIGSMPKWIQEQPDPTPSIQKLADWYVEVLDYGITQKKWPITIVEVFNEEMLGHPEAENQLRYTFYNLLAAKVKAKFPHLKIGGSAECWPDVRFLERFAERCGENLDIITWHMYSTGKATTPPEQLFAASDSFAKVLVRIKEMLDKKFPGKTVEQAITEYNMNYAAWKPVDYRLQKGLGSAWLFTVLRNLLYSGEADHAFFWHYWGGGSYGSLNGDATIRPSGTLFQLLNEQLTDAQIVRADSSSDDIELFAAENSNSYLIALVNKTASKKSIKLNILNLNRYFDSRFDHPVTEYRIGPEETQFTVSKIPAISRKTNQISLEGFSLSIRIIPK